MLFKIDAGCDFDHGQPVLGQLDDAAFGDVEHLLATLAGHLTGEGDLGDLGHKLRDRAVGDDLELAVGDLDVLLAGGEVAGVNDLGRAGDDVIEAAYASSNVRPSRQ